MFRDTYENRSSSLANAAALHARIQHNALAVL